MDVSNCWSDAHTNWVTRASFSSLQFAHSCTKCTSQLLPSGQSEAICPRKPYRLIIYQDHPYFQNSSQAVPKLEVKLTTHQIKRRQQLQCKPAKPLKPWLHLGLPWLHLHQTYTRGRGRKLGTFWRHVTVRWFNTEHNTHPCLSGAPFILARSFEKIVFQLGQCRWSAGSNFSSSKFEQPYKPK